MEHRTDPTAANKLATTQNCVHANLSVNMGLQLGQKVRQRRSRVVRLVHDQDVVTGEPGGDNRTRSRWLTRQNTLVNVEWTVAMLLRAVNSDPCSMLTRTDDAGTHELFPQ